MPSPKLKLISIAAIALLVLSLNTNGYAMEGAEAGAEGGEGEGKAAAAPMPKDEKDFYDKTSRLNSLETRIQEAEKQFQELVERKDEEKDVSEKQRIIKQMVEVTKDRNKSTEEYQKIKAELSLRYPNRGERLNRHYETQGKKSVEAADGAAGLDELLTRTKKIIEKKFAAFDEPEKKNAPAALAEPAASGEEKPKRLRLEK